MKFYNYILLVVFVAIGTSCKKNFLDVEDKRNLIEEFYVTDLATTGEYLNGVYVEFASQFNQSAYPIYCELVADNEKPASTLLTAQYTWSQIADNDASNRPSFNGFNMNGLWLAGYKVIRDCNTVVANADKYRNEDPDKADNIIGQALFLRAYVHTCLVNVFAQSFNYTIDGSHAGIPYVTSSDWQGPVTRQTVAEVYANIISDLNNAILLLPSQQITPSPFPNTILANRNAAKALLARSFLFKEDYQLAKNLALEVGITVPIITGANYPSKLFTDQEAEALFQIAPSSASVAASPGAYTTSFPGSIFNSQSIFATADIATSFRTYPTDIRNSWVTPSGNKWKITKFPSNVIPGFSNPAASYYQTLLRSSEMYLTAAEAYAKLNNEDSARFFINTIRTRAKIPVITSSVTGTALLDSIYNERRKELAFEGLRMFDLLRWKKSVIRMDATSPSYQTLPYPSNKAIAPLPDQDVQLSGLSQNLDY